MLTTTFRSPKSSGNRVVVDLEVFGQILELDEGDGREFSQDVVEGYLEQAQATIKLMDEILCAGLSLRVILMSHSFSAQSMS